MKKILFVLVFGVILTGCVAETQGDAESSSKKVNKNPRVQSSIFELQE